VENHTMPLDNIFVMCFSGENSLVDKQIKKMGDIN
jgi:hypothetical protein